MQGGLPYDPLAANFARAFQELIVGIEYDAPPEPISVNRKAMANKRSKAEPPVQQASHTQLVTAEASPTPDPSTLQSEPAPAQIPRELLPEGPPASVPSTGSSEIAQATFSNPSCPPGAELPPPGPPPRFFPVPSRPVFSQQPATSWLR